MNFQFQYASYRTRERAEAALEDMFASGEIHETEHPRIVRKANGFFAIMIDG